MTAFLERYLPLFYRQEQRVNARLVIEGRLSHLDRKTCEPITRQAGVERKPIQFFVGAGKWDDEAVMGEVRQHVAEEFCDPQATFVLDGSAFPKKGSAIPGNRAGCTSFLAIRRESLYCSLPGETESGSAGTQPDKG